MSNAQNTIRQTLLFPADNMAIAFALSKHIRPPTNDKQKKKQSTEVHTCVLHMSERLAVAVVVVVRFRLFVSISIE